MTEREHWFKSASPAALLYKAKQFKVLKPRKSLLFCCGCYRYVWGEIRAASVKNAVELAEEKADRKITQVELAKYHRPGGHPPDRSFDHYLQLSISSLLTP